MTINTDQTAPTWDEFWSRIGNEEWLTAKALLEVDPHFTVGRDAAQWVRYSESDGYRDDAGEWQMSPEIDWEAWVAHVDEHGRGWSSSEHRLFSLVASLVVPERPTRLVGVLDQLGSWEVDVWRVLVEWGTGGNNREHRGRAAVVDARSQPRHDGAVA